MPADVYDVGEVPLGVQLIDQTSRQRTARTLDRALCYSMPLGENVEVRGYFQSYKLFAFVEKEIRILYTFKHDLYAHAQSLLYNIMKTFPTAVNNIVFVGVHVRMGDLNMVWYSDPLKYLTSAMNMYRNNYTGMVHFVVCSDSPQWCRQNLRNISDVTLVSGNQAIQDLAILSHCNHSIITFGSFGWWGAYLSGGNTVYFKDYQQPEYMEWISDHKITYYPWDLYPMHWIGLDPKY
jgi:galactoside 2-L-fucosyltransferase 1/2